MIRSFHFFNLSDRPDSQGLLKCFTISCEVITLATELDEAQDFGTYLPNFYARMITVAAYTILRIHKSSLRDILTTPNTEDSYFSAIDLYHKRSVKPGDLDILNAIMLTKLWSSQKVYVKADGICDSLRLGYRSRMVCCPLHVHY
jgi:hypothetical protein